MFGMSLPRISGAFIMHHMVMCAWQRASESASAPQAKSGALPTSIMSRSFQNPPTVLLVLLCAHIQRPEPMSTSETMDIQIGEMSCPTRLALP